MRRGPVMLLLSSPERIWKYRGAQCFLTSLYRVLCVVAHVAEGLFFLAILIHRRITCYAIKELLLCQHQHMVLLSVAKGWIFNLSVLKSGFSLEPRTPSAVWGLLHKIASLSLLIIIAKTLLAR